MATRSGEIVYSAVIFIKKKLGLKDEEITTLLNKESGLLGISGYTKDMKTLISEYETNQRAKLAIDLYANKIAEFIGSFYVLLGGCVLLVFTGGIGSGSDFIREKISRKVEISGLGINYENNKGAIDVIDTLDISQKNRILAIRTDEEKHIVNQVLKSSFE